MCGLVADCDTAHVKCNYQMSCCVSRICIHICHYYKVLKTFKTVYTSLKTMYVQSSKNVHNKVHKT